MNHIFKSLWNPALGVWVAVSERAKTPSRRSGSYTVSSTGALHSHTYQNIFKRPPLVILPMLLGLNLIGPSHAQITTQQRANGVNVSLDQPVNISLTGTGTAGYGLWAQNNGQITATTDQLMIASSSSSALFADSGGKITLDGTGGILDISNQSQSSLSPIISVAGSGSSISLTNALIHGRTGASINQIYGASVTAGAKLSLTNSSISVVGGTGDSQSGPTAINATGAGSLVELNNSQINLTTVSTNGGGMTGVAINSQATATGDGLTINMNSGTAGPQVGLKAVGTGANATFSNITLKGNATTTSNQILTMTQAASGGTLTLNGGTISGNGISSALSSNFSGSTLNANNLTIATTQTRGSQLISAGNGGTLNITDSTISSSSAQSMIMVAALVLNSTVNLKDTNITFTYGSSDANSGFGLYGFGLSLITADNVHINADTRSYGARAIGAYTNASRTDAQIQFTNGSSINLIGGNAASSPNSASYGVLAAGVRNTFTGSDSSVTTARSSASQGTGVTAISAQTGGTANLTRMQISASGTGSMGVSSIGTDALVNLNAGNIITTNGTNAYGLAIQNGAVLDGSNAIGTSVQAQGTNANAVYFSGAGTTNLASLRGVALNSTAASAITVASSNANLTLSEGTVNAGNGIWLDVAAGANAAITLNNAEHVTGATRLGATGNSDLSVNSNATWNITGDSRLSNLSFDGGGVLYDANARITTDTALTLNAGGGFFNTNGLSVDLTNQLLGSGQLQKTGAGTLTLTHAGNSVGSVDIQEGALILDQNGTFTTSDDFTTRTGATLRINSTPTTLNIGGLFTQEAGSTLDIVLGASPDIVADRANLSGTLNFTGFDAGTAPVLASEVIDPARRYRMIQTANGITGDYTNTITGTDYLLNFGGVTADGKNYDLGFHLAWTEGREERGTGTFTLAEGTAFNVDIVLKDQSVFDRLLTEWDGNSLTKDGAGALTLSAANTYTGTTTLNEGILKLTENGTIANSSALKIEGSTAQFDISEVSNGGTTVNNLSGVAGSRIILGDKTLNIDNTTTTDFAGIISGTGGLVKTGLDTLTLSGENTYVGPTRITEGTLSIGAGGTTGSLKSTRIDLIDDTTLNFNRSNDSEYAGIIAGTQNTVLQKLGDGKLSLSTSDSVIGSSVIQAGTLEFTQGGRFTTFGDYTTQAGATTSLANAYSYLQVGGAFKMENNSTLGVFVDPRVGVQYADISAQSAEIGNNATLNITGFSADYSSTNSSAYELRDITILHTADGLNFVNGATDFTNFSVGGATQPVDYLVIEGKKIGDTDYTVGVGLLWYGARFLPEGDQAATGNFTLSGVNERFQVDAALNNEAAVGQSGTPEYWDGQSLTKKGAGTLILSAANTYTGDTTVEDGTLTLVGAGDISASSQLNLASANVIFDMSNVEGASRQVNNLTSVEGSQIIIGSKTLSVNNQNDTLVAGDVATGTGGLIKTGVGELTFSGQTGWTGTTELQGGTLTLDGTNGGGQLFSNIIGQTGTTFNLKNGASLTGSIDPTDVNIDDASVWNMTGNSIVNNLTHSGTINFITPTHDVFHTLNIEGNYVGNNGTIFMNTQLGGDASLTDRLVITGDTSGTTKVQINNMGGSGQKTLNGIELITVKGASNGEFTQIGRIVAGAYDYVLARGTHSSTAGNWYLTSNLSTIDPTQPVEPSQPIFPLLPSESPSTQSRLRPEAASYIANLAAANTLFTMNLADRMGSSQAVADNETTHSQAFWLRSVGGQNRFSDQTGQLKSKSTHYMLQLGHDLASWNTDQTGQITVGVMAGYAHNQSEEQSVVTKYRSKGSVSGYSVGVYGTWYANAQDQTGAYVDTWAQYNWFNNRVTGDHIQQERYRSQGLSASLEAGYRFKVGSGDTLDYFIQPQAQAIWMGVNAGDHRESNGTHISNQKGNQLETRVGIKMSAHTQKDLAARTDTSLNMFVEANWIHHAKDFDIRMDDVSVKQGGARNVGEIKVGIESKLNKQLSLWGNVSHQRGSQGFKDTSLNVGLKYQF